MLISITTKDGKRVTNKAVKKPQFDTIKEKMYYIFCFIMEEAKKRGTDKRGSSLIGSRYTFYRFTGADKKRWDTISVILEKTTTEKDIKQLLDIVYPDE